MVKKRHLIGIIAILIIFVATLLVVFMEKNDDDKRAINLDLYFFNDTYTSIVAENRQIAYENVEDLPGLTLKELQKAPQDSKKKAIIPEDALVLSVKEKKRDIVVDFSKEYVCEDTSRTFLSTYAIVKSLCQINGVNRVLVTVEGEEIVASDGTVIGYLGEDDIDLVSDTKTQDSKTLELYFADRDEDKLVKEKRVIKITDTMPIEQYVVSELIKGTSNEKLRNVIAADTQLISAQTTDGICFVNFKSGFIEKNTGKNAQLVLYSIVNSLCEIDGVGSVQFLVDGKKVDKFGEFDISEILDQDESFIK